MNQRGRRPRSDITRVFLLIAASVLAPPFAAAQVASRPTASTQPGQQPYALRVTGDRVNIRSRPDANSVPLCRVERGTVLRAVGRQYGWHRVVPPEGAFSYVSAAYIERRGENEGVVSITSGALRARVGSTVQDLDPQTYEVQVLLAPGTPVRILGIRGDWLMIAPPEGAWGYVANEQVERVDATVATSLPAAHSASTLPSGPAAASQPTTEPASRPVEGPDLSGMWGQRLTLIEAAIESETHRPALEQKWDTLITRLRPIARQHEEPMVARLAEAWIAKLEQRIVEQDTARMAEEVLRKAEREHGRHERELERIKRVREQPATEPAFAARGALQRSFALGERDGKKWYVLQNPVTKDIEAYLEIDPQAGLAPEDWLGRYVGVRGERRKDKELGADVVRVSEIVGLKSGEAPETQPTRREP